jgi:ferredoxin/flavodoxin---NADP+ reductase
MSTVSSDKHEKAKIVFRQEYAANLWKVRMRPEQPLVFKPGQYTTLGVEEGGRLIERAYSIASSPLEEELEFFIELVPDGEVSQHLRQLQVGNSIYVRRQPKGLFTLDETSGHRNHYLVATVTGVAPYVSMARTLGRQAENGHPPDLHMVILQAASHSREFAYREELEALARSQPWFDYIPTVSRPWEDTSWQGEVGRADDVVRKHLDRLGLEPADTTTYLCGNPQMIENAKGILARRGFAKEFIREEIYWVPKKK